MSGVTELVLLQLVLLQLVLLFRSALPPESRRHILPMPLPLEFRKYNGPGIVPFIPPDNGFQYRPQVLALLRKEIFVAHRLVLVSSPHHQPYALHFL